MKDVTLVEVIVGLISMLIGWLHMRQTALERELKSKADKADMEEVKTDLKQVLNNISDLKVDNARWQGLVEQALNSKQERS